MSLIIECPECGRYIVERDDLDEGDFVEQEVCDRCRDRERRFEDGFAEYEETGRSEGRWP